MGGSPCRAECPSKRSGDLAGMWKPGHKPPDRLSGWVADSGGGQQPEGGQTAPPPDSGGNGALDSGLPHLQGQKSVRERPNPVSAGSPWLEEALGPPAGIKPPPASPPPRGFGIYGKSPLSRVPRASRGRRGKMRGTGTRPVLSAWGSSCCPAGTGCSLSLAREGTPGKDRRCERLDGGTGEAQREEAHGKGRASPGAWTPS